MKLSQMLADTYTDDFDEQVRAVFVSRAKALEKALQLIEENSHLVREPIASLKSIGLIARTALESVPQKGTEQ